MVIDPSAPESGPLAWLDCLLRIQGARALGTNQPQELLNQCAQAISQWTDCESVWLGLPSHLPSLHPGVSGAGTELGALAGTLRSALEHPLPTPPHHGFAPQGGEPATSAWHWTTWTAPWRRLPAPLVRWMVQQDYRTLSVLYRENGQDCDACLLLASHDSRPGLGEVHRMALQALACDALTLLQQISAQESAPQAQVDSGTSDDPPVLNVLAQLNHDARTPLNSIAAAIYLTLQTELPDTPRRYIEQAAQSASRLSDILANALSDAQTAQMAAPSRQLAAEMTGCMLHPSPPEPEPEDFSHSELDATLASDMRALATLLEEHDTNARLMVNMVTHKLKQVGCVHAADRMRTLVREYEFDLALQMLKQAAAFANIQLHSEGATP